MKNPKKVTWCENWLKASFAKLPIGITGIECNHLFELAAKAGLYTPDTYGSELSDALLNLNVKVRTVKNDSDEFMYHAFHFNERDRVNLQ